jgi:restriction system protein
MSEEDVPPPGKSMGDARYGGYRRMRSFIVAQAIYDGTVIFCDRFIDRRSRTHDQMVQAARSGRQNIAEGSMAAATSKKSELKLTNVAKASLEELLLDYEDFLRHRDLPLWSKDSSDALAIRERHLSTNEEQGRDPYGIGDASATVAANTLICLIHQATYLLKRQVQRLEARFVEEGGYTENLYRRRVSDRSSGGMQREATVCPMCGKQMVKRTARQGSRAGEAFWGCSGFPECKGIRHVDSGDR